MFHIQCWHDNLNTCENRKCPNCLTQGRVIARWRYSTPTKFDNIPNSQHALTDAAPVNSNRQPTRHTPVSQFMAPWWPSEPSNTPSPATQLANGRLSLIVDPAAWTNLMGAKLAKQLAQLAVDSGYQPRQWKMTEPLEVAGVGNGTHTAEWCLSIPIALEGEDGSTATAHALETPVVEGAGDDIPGLLGLRSMRARRGVLEMTEGKEYLTFPGPGGYTITWSPGTVRLPLHTTPSGHLAVPIDSFGKVKLSAESVSELGLTFHTHMATAADPQRPLRTCGDVVHGSAGSPPSEETQPATARPSTPTLSLSTLIEGSAVQPDAKQLQQNTRFGHR